MFRDLLAHVDGSQAGRRRVRFAAELATLMGSRLTGLHVTPPTEVRPLYKPSLVPTVEAQTASSLAVDAMGAARIFDDETKQRSLRTCWFAREGDVALQISKEARYADLVILGQYEWQGSPEAHPLPIAHSVVLQCGRPVLVVPADAPPAKFERIVVAWDGSREAVRAVHDALPLLRLAQSVQIVMMVSQTEADRGIDERSLPAHLSNHEIKVGANILNFTTAEEHEALRQRIEQGHYDLLVMGAYSHPRWLELIFGGATKSILLSSKIPVLVSH